MRIIRLLQILHELPARVPVVFIRRKGAIIDTFFIKGLILTEMPDQLTFELVSTPIGRQTEWLLQELFNALMASRLLPELYFQAQGTTAYELVNAEYIDNLVTLELCPTF